MAWFLALDLAHLGYDFLLSSSILSFRIAYFFLATGSIASLEFFLFWKFFIGQLDQCTFGEACIYVDNVYTYIFRIISMGIFPKQLDENDI